jgi:micrococcal nuclease
LPPALAALAALAVLALLASTAACRAPAATESQTTSTLVAPNATVLGVVDGDTIEVSVAGQRETVRLIGIDTPETHHPTEPVQCFGPEASEATRALLPDGTRVRLERDLEPRDHYGRLLAYVYRVDGTFVNLELARQGAADALSISPNTAHAAAVRAAVAEARRAERGLWGACAGFGVPA